MQCAERVSRIAQSLDQANVDALFLTSAESMGYTQGFFEDAHERFLVLAISASGRVRLICPALSVDQAKRTGIQDVRGWRDGELPAHHIHELLDDWDLRRAVVAVDNTMHADHMLLLQSLAPSIMFRPAQNILGSLMAVKDEGELDALRKGGALVEEVFEAILPTIRPGETERQLAGRIQAEVLARGAGLNFCIVAAGAGSAEPHHLPNDTVLSSGDVVLLDFGCVWKGYHADITRVVHFGPAPNDVKEVYRVVREAYNAGLAAVAPGVKASDVDHATRKVIDQAGYGHYFVHRTGHGIGLRGHEAPNISADNAEVLVPGHCFSIEPGVYLPGRFGIRLENIVSCGPNGADPINRKEFEEEILELL